MREQIFVDSLDLNLEIAENTDALGWLFKIQLALSRNYGINVEVTYDFVYEPYGFYTCIHVVRGKKYIYMQPDPCYAKHKDYLKALEVGINEAIKLIKDEK